MSNAFRTSLQGSAYQNFYVKLLQWIEAENPKHVHLLVSGKDHHLSPGPHQYRLLCGLNWKDAGCTDLKDVDEYAKGEFCFGVLPYELKNEVEDLSSLNKEYYPEMGYLLMQPEVLLSVRHDGSLSLESENQNPRELFEEIQGLELRQASLISESNTQFDSDISDAQYLENVERIRNEIEEGNVYELSYCRNFYSHQKTNPFALYKSFIQLNATPFSAFVKNGSQYVVCGSMERFLCKQGTKVISQPIKGTAHNSGNNAETEKAALLDSEKERAENLMIVDLVRNDLSKSAKVGSVTVPELFGIYSYPNVHQMISTVEAQASEHVTLSQYIKDAFPMGSMTGAPKLKAMQLIEELEQFKRGTYSGSIGYVDAHGNFDWNVVIRSVIYDAESHSLSIPVGSAITYDSIPEDELNECRVKVARIMDLVRAAAEE